MSTYEYKQCPMCRAWIGEEPHTCGGNKIGFANALMPDASPMVQWHGLVDLETKDYLRRIAEALEALVNLMTPSQTETPPRRYDEKLYIAYADGSDSQVIER